MSTHSGQWLAPGLIAAALIGLAACDGRPQVGNENQKTSSQNASGDSQNASPERGGADQDKADQKSDGSQQ